eukprot:scaffold6952_cov18-Tisochrysis_lutea.AAC.1
MLTWILEGAPVMRAGLHQGASALRVRLTAFVSQGILHVGIARIQHPFLHTKDYAAAGMAVVGVEVKHKAQATLLSVFLFEEGKYSDKQEGNDHFAAAEIRLSDRSWHCQP